VPNLVVVEPGTDGDVSSSTGWRGGLTVDRAGFGG
jgi:hypothetical protein